jgi:hypothetical protein
MDNNGNTELLEHFSFIGRLPDDLLVKHPKNFLPRCQI